MEYFTEMRWSPYVVGVGIYAMKAMGWNELSIKSGSLGKNVVGGLMF